MKKVLFVILLLCMAFPMRAQEKATEDGIQAFNKGAAIYD